MKFCIILKLALKTDKNNAYKSNSIIIQKTSQSLNFFNALKPPVIDLPPYVLGS
jgi:hypothetical protein